MMDTPDDLKIESSDSISTLTSLFEKKPQSVFLSQFSRNKNKKEVSSESLIKIFATHQSANYAEPWVGSSAEECTGSGFVIQHNSTNYIVTNAHVAGDSKYIQVRIAGKNKKYTAVPLQVCYQSDLAILAVKDLAFQQQSKPVAIGDMVALQESVKVMGFPIGGDGLSVTEGIVSRVESGTYEIGRVKMLQIQIDAAINPGNSGGPVFSEGKVIGVAFQGRDDGESLGYIIPAPILNHFLQECFQEKSYQGFPELPIKITELENEYLRSHYGMDTEQTGVLISQIDGLSDAALKLKKDDILLAISGFPISNEGKVNLPGIEEEVDFTHLFHMHYIGDSIELEVLRQGELVSISVLLDCTPHQTKKLSQDEHDKLPTYYFASGVLFQPLTMNY
ncbi:MAG: Sid related protein, partial [Pseudomonadota bacterium]